MRTRNGAAVSAAEGIPDLPHVSACAVGGLGTIPELPDADLASIIAALDDPEMEVRAA